MSCTEVNHIALTVESLRQAENLYTQLFGCTILFREGASADGGIRLSAEDGWGDTEDIILDRSCLERKGLRLLLMCNPDGYVTPGRIDHVCLQMEPDELDRLRLQAEILDCRIERPTPSSWIMEDPYGIRWVLLTRCDEDLKKALVP